VTAVGVAEGAGEDGPVGGLSGVDVVEVIALHFGGADGVIFVAGFAIEAGFGGGEGVVFGDHFVVGEIAAGVA